MKKFSFGYKKNSDSISMGYFWVIFLICLAPTILSLLGVEIGFGDYKIISFSKASQNLSSELVLGKIFTTIWIIFSIAVGIFTFILAIIDFKVKKDIAAPVIGVILVCNSVFDMVQLLIILGAVKMKLGADEAIYISWFISRIFHACLLIAGSFFILSFSYGKEKSKESSDQLKLISWIFGVITIILIIYVLNIQRIPQVFISKEGFFTHPLEIISIILYLIWGGLLMPKILKLFPGIFFQMLILSMIPAIFSDAHMAVFYKNFDIEYNFAQFLKLFTYIIPLLGISINYSRNLAKQHQMNIILDGEVKAKEKIQQDLERRQSLLQHAEKMANMGSWDLDVATREINFSDALYKIFGYAPNSVSPNLDLMFNMIIPEYRAPYKSILEEAISNQSSFNTEYEVLWVSGERRYILAQGRYIHADHKLIGTCLDITELRETSQKLSQNEILLKETESISHNGSFEWFNGVDHFFWSEELFRIHGYEPNSIAITLQFYQTLIHPDDRKNCEKLVKKVLVTNNDFAVEYRIIRSDQEVRYVYLTAKIIRKNGSIHKIIGNLQDITELKNTAILLEETESIYKTIAGNVPDSVLLMYDKKFNLILFDGPILGDMKFKSELVPGIHLSELFSEEEYEMNATLLGRAFEGQEFQTEQEFENDKTFMIDFKPVRNSAGDIFNVMVVMHDITEIKKVQKNLESKIDELNRSNQDLEQFAYVASHDLQEPLRKIRAFGSRLQSKFSKDISEEGLDYIRRMQGASERMQTLIDDLLTFSRVTRTEEVFVSVDLHDQLKKIVDDLEFTIEKKNADITIITNEWIDAIPGQIRQLFQNLISNAIKFSKDHVPPVVEIKSELLKGDALEYASLDSLKDYCKITVKDNGIGFEQQYADRIFELFQRLHSRVDFQGTGIGLAVCKKIVEKHNGIIKVSSQLNEGTIFTIILPVHQ